MSLIIKVCGLRQGDNIRGVEALGVDWIGMIFYPKSPRYVTMVPTLAGIIPDAVPDDVKKEKGGAKRVGVFVNASVQEVITRVVNYGLDIVQLHGDEQVTYIDNLRRTLDPDIHRGIRLMKVISVTNADDIALTNRYEGHVDYFLFDTKTSARGGSGRRFDWDALEYYHGDTPFLLSGGIGPDDASMVLKFSHPRLIGVDLNSKFEKAPALKDIDKLREFISALRGKA